MQKNDLQFTNFKVHSQFSICEGAVKIDELADYCKKNNIKAIGLCDSYNLCGALEFSEKISKVGTHPIIGSQINFKVNDTISRISLFATTETGYRNLTKLSSKYYSQFAEDVTLDRLFKKKKSGFFVDVGCYHPIKFNNTYKLYNKE